MLHKKTNKAGISFIEVLVILLLMSLFMSFAAPRFLTTQRGRVKKEFFQNFTTLVADTAYQAVISKKIHQIFWDLGKREIVVKIYDENSAEQGKHAKFKPVPAGTFHSRMKLAPSLSIQNFFINGKDEVTSGVQMTTVFTYIMPDGTSQPVLVNIQDDNETANNRFSIKINPFYSQVSLHDTFEKP
ncbi:hypothetical protein A3J41_01815 [candidate division TM6 bacterium RIFCSPHIGHO2_12_FULL_38_8]|nr:MAG: hypothetical protein A3J41_01815 [candidate division TM6 bacterium RIFCSPHIGHO2_12_FULL_38_8]